jgi:hypothetical protein
MLTKQANSYENSSINEADSISNKRVISNQKFQNVSQIIDNLLKNYDIRLRPNFGGNFHNFRLTIV